MPIFLGLVMLVVGLFATARPDAIIEAFEHGKYPTHTVTAPAVALPLLSNQTAGERVADEATAFLKGIEFDD